MLTGVQHHRGINGIPANFFLTSGKLTTVQTLLEQCLEYVQGGENSVAERVPVTGRAHCIPFTM